MLSFTVDAILSNKTKSIKSHFHSNDVQEDDDALRVPPFHSLPLLSIKIPNLPHIRCISKYGTAITNDPYFGRVAVSLENVLLWEMFRKVGTEMVITKSGRRMFPALRFSVSGLHPSKRYAVAIEIFSADNYRYKYHDSEWCITGKAFPETPRKQRMCVHGDSPANGFKWCSNIISFHKLKITNNTTRSNQKQIILNSLQKYQPRLRITEVYSDKDVMADDIDLESFPSMTFEFPEATFIAVTAYQSEQITQLKIDNNPFAKGFRDPTPAEIERVMKSSWWENRFIIPTDRQRYFIVVSTSKWLSDVKTKFCACWVLRTRLINPSLYNMLIKSKEHSINIKYHCPSSTPPSPPLPSIPPALHCYRRPTTRSPYHHPYSRSSSNIINYYPTNRDKEIRQRAATRSEKIEKKLFTLQPPSTASPYSYGGRLPSCLCCTGSTIWPTTKWVDARSQMIA